MNSQYSQSVVTINTYTTGKSNQMRWSLGDDLLDKRLTKYTNITTKTIKLNFNILHINQVTCFGDEFTIRLILPV
jgi:hypothetical protein